MRSSGDRGGEVAVRCGADHVLLGPEHRADPVELGVQLAAGVADPAGVGDGAVSANRANSRAQQKAHRGQIDHQIPRWLAYGGVEGSVDQEEGEHAGLTAHAEHPDLSGRAGLDLLVARARHGVDGEDGSGAIECAGGLPSHR